MFKTSKRVEGAHEEGIWAVKWTEETICSGSLDGTVKLWNDKLSLNSTSHPTKMGITSVSVLNTAGIVVSCSQDSTIQFHDVVDLKTRQSLQPGFLEAWTVSSSRDDKLIAGGSHSGSINVWRVEDGKISTVFETGNKLITDVSFSPRGDKLAAVGADGMLSVFDIEGGKLCLQTEAHALAARSVRFSPDGNLIYTGSVDRHVNIYDLNHPVAVNSFSHSGMVLCLDTSPNNRLFVSSCSNHSVHLWDIGMQRSLQSFDTQHCDQVWGVCFNESGNKFISVGDDSSMQIYENTSTR